MILEVEDILNQKNQIEHMVWPENITLGQVMDHERLRDVEKMLVSVSVNEMDVSNWKSFAPQKGDRVRVRIAPRGFLFVPVILGLSIMQVLSVVSVLISAIQFVMKLFASPPKPKSGGRRDDSQIYSFDGIKTAVTPGNPIPVTYGQHIGAGQMLSAFVDVFDSGKRQNLSMLIGYGEGPVTNISCIKVNGTAIEDIKSVTAEYRFGTTSQAPISGFDQIRNTFADQREIGSGFPITYSSVSNSLSGIQLQISAAEGLAKVVDGQRIGATMDYSIERRPTGGGAFTVVTSPRKFTGRTLSPIWDVVDLAIDTPGAYDIRLSFLRQSPPVATGGSIYDPGGMPSGRIVTKGRLWLTNVTEKEGFTYAFSGIAHIGIKAIATSQLNHQLPTVTAVIKGRSVEVYSTTAVKTVTWTQNPAWCVADYLTNSLYGMGAFMQVSDLNLQSFIDFATLCNSTVPNGRGGLEQQHHLDLVMDTRKSHWQWVQDMLSLYKSTLIYSQQQWKVITDRQDLPLRQVFHSGNIVPGTMNIKIGGDPLKPNQANVNFANELLDYEMDPIYIQDSASVMGAGSPIKDYDMEARGIVRETEAIRLGQWDLSRKRAVRREVEFQTGLEGIVVEPGDMCRVGLVSTNYEMGWGGRILDGSSRHAVLDHEVTVQSGYTYDLFIWHIQADTPETRTIATTVAAGGVSLITAVVSPTSGFNFQVMPDDRWSMGVASRDLMLCQVKEVSHAPNGRTRIVAEQFVFLNPTTPTGAKIVSDIIKAPQIGTMPAQPVKVVVTEHPQFLKDGTVVSDIVIGIAPAPLYEGGRLTVPATLGSVTLTGASSHNPNANALIGEQLKFISGAASGLSPTIGAWAGMPTLVASVFPAFAAANVPASGDPYQLIKHVGLYAGMDIQTVTESNNPASPQWAPMETYYGTEIVIPGVTGQSLSVSYKLVPLSDRGIRNENGTWVVSLTTHGDTIAPDAPGSIFAVQGTGKDISVQVIPTSQADLWGHLFYRHTANCLTNAQTVGFGITDYHDADIVYETPYFYWARPVDYSFNVGSPVGPATITGSRVSTSDITSNAISNVVELSSTDTPGIVNVETTIGSLAIATLGGLVLLTGKLIMAHNPVPAAFGIYESRLRVGSIGGTILDHNRAYATVNSTDLFLYNQATHAAPVGTNNYFLTVRTLDATSGTLKDMRMQAIELKR